MAGPRLGRFLSPCGPTPLTYADVRRRHRARVVGLARRWRAAQRRRGAGAGRRVGPRGRHRRSGRHAGAAASLVAADLVRVVTVAVAVVVIVTVICITHKHNSGYRSVVYKLLSRRIRDDCSNIVTADRSHYYIICFRCYKRNRVPKIICQSTDYIETRSWFRQECLLENSTPHPTHHYNERTSLPYECVDLNDNIME